MRLPTTGQRFAASGEYLDSARSLPIVPTTPVVCSSTMSTGSLAGPLFLACTTSPLGPLRVA
jgi:hypothetical protein